MYTHIVYNYSISLSTFPMRSEYKTYFTRAACTYLEKCQLTILAARVDNGGFHYQLLLVVWCDIGKIINSISVYNTIYMATYIEPFAVTVTVL